MRKDSPNDDSPITSVAYEGVGSKLSGSNERRWIGDTYHKHEPFENVTVSMRIHVLAYPVDRQFNVSRDVRLHASNPFL